MGESEQEKKVARKSERSAKRKHSSHRSKSSRKSGRSARSSSRKSSRKSSRSHGRSGRASSSRRRHSHSRKSSRGSKRGSKSRKSSRSRKSDRSEARHHSHRYRLWMKLQAATMEKRRRAESRKKMSKVLQFVMVMVLGIILLFCIALTILAYIHQSIDNEFWCHIGQIIIELVLLAVCAVVMVSSRQALRDLHTSLLVAACSWNVLMLLYSMWGSAWAEFKYRHWYYDYRNDYQHGIIANHSLAISHLFALFGNTIAALLSIGSIIFINSYTREMNEVSTSSFVLNKALEEDRLRRWRRHQKKAYRDSMRKNSRKSRKSSTSGRSSKKSSKKSSKRRDSGKMARERESWMMQI